MRRRRKPRQQGGFIIVDVLIAIALVAVLFPAVLGLIAATGRVSGRTDERLVISLAARNKHAIERFLLHPTE